MGHEIKVDAHHKSQGGCKAGDRKCQIPKILIKIVFGT